MNDKPMMHSDPKQIIQTLSNSDQAWQQGNRLVLMKYGRWHYLTLFHDLRGIATVNFVTADRAEVMVSNMLANANLLHFSDIAPNFPAELTEKVLLDAESYRPLLANGRCHLVIGHTTDTLRSLEEDIDTLVQTIQQRIDGQGGAYISFR